MKLSWDELKRQAALADRGLDFADAEVVFASAVVEWKDIRKDYGEGRMLCVGLLLGRLVVVGYVQRGQSRHIFSMRKANEREQARFGQ
jgi:uncharacterized DUF497 family protein